MEESEIRRDDIGLIGRTGSEVAPGRSAERRGDSEGLQDCCNGAPTGRDAGFDFRGENPGRLLFLAAGLRFEERGVRFETRRLPVPAAPSFGTASRPARSAGNDVFFVSPDGSWEAGVHALVVTIDDRTIKLPVWLR